MIKRTIHVRENADVCLKAIYMTYFKDNIKANYSSIISDALEFYFQNIKKKTGIEIQKEKTK